MGLVDALRGIVGSEHARADVDRRYLEEAIGNEVGEASAVVFPATAGEVAAVVTCCYERGGGTGLAGGAVPHGGVVVSLERLTRIRSFDPLLWRIHAEAGVPTQELRRIARESGLFFPPDPGRRNSRSSVAITAAWLRLIPAPEASFPIVAFYRDTSAGCEAIESVFGSGIEAAALEYLDRGTFAITRRAYPGDAPEDAFVVVAEADGSASEAARIRDDLIDVLGQSALALQSPDAGALWRWREGISHAVAGSLGSKLAEDVAVPVDALARAVELTVETGARHGLEAVSWGHAGDGNRHSNFLFDPATDGRARASDAAAELLSEIVALGGTISGEHGIGSLKLPYLGLQLSPPALAAMRAIKQALDPKGLFNPGKVI